MKSIRDGEIIDSDNSNNFDRERIVKAMIGRDLSESAYAEDNKQKRPKIQIKIGKLEKCIEFSKLGKQLRN